MLEPLKIQPETQISKCFMWKIQGWVISPYGHPFCHDSLQGWCQLRQALSRQAPVAQLPQDLEALMAQKSANIVVQEIFGPKLFCTGCLKPCEANLSRNCPLKRIAITRQSPTFRNSLPTPRSWQGRPVAVMDSGLRCGPLCCKQKSKGALVSWTVSRKWWPVTVIP